MEKIIGIEKHAGKVRKYHILGNKTNRGDIRLSFELMKKLLKTVAFNAGKRNPANQNFSLAFPLK